MKKLRRIVLFFVACLFVSACARRPENEAGRLSEIKVENGRISAVVSKKLTIDAEVVSPDKAEAQILHVTNRPLPENWKELCRIILQEDELSYREPEENFGTAQGYTENYSKALMLSYGGFLIYDDETLTDKPYRSFNDKWVLSGELPTFPTPFVMYAGDADTVYPEEIPGFPVEEAVKMVRGICDRLEIPLAAQPRTIHGFDAETLEKKREESNSLCASEEDPRYLPEAYTSEDAYYFFSWDYAYEGIPLVPYYNNVAMGHVVARGTTGFEGGVVLSAYVRRNGVLHMANTSTDSYMILGKEEPGTILSVEEAAKRLPEYFEKVILEEPRVVKTLRLCYVPVLTTADPKNPENNEFDLIPCWVGETYYEREGQRWWEISYMNALTGEFLPVD